jgi:hypothetical protein
MVGRSPGRRRLHAVKAQIRQIQRIDERIDDANRITLIDEIIEAFRQQRPLPAICPRNEALHRSPAESSGES